MKKLLLAIAPFFMIGCVERNPDGSIKSGTGGYQTIKIDSCEYIYGWYKLAHKGNCRFCQERRQKELEELVIRCKTNQDGVVIDTVVIYKDKKK